MRILCLIVVSLGMILGGCIRTAVECETSADCPAAEVCSSQGLCLSGDAPRGDAGDAGEDTSGDASTGCPGGELSCGGRCVTCPSSRGAQLACADAACVIASCQDGFTPCELGCCVTPTGTGALSDGAPLPAAPGAVAIAASPTGVIWIAYVDRISGALAVARSDGSGWGVLRSDATECAGPVAITTQGEEPFVAAACGEVKLLVLDSTGEAFRTRDRFEVEGITWLDAFVDATTGAPFVVYTEQPELDAPTITLRRDDATTSFALLDRGVEHIDAAYADGRLHIVHVVGSSAFYLGKAEGETWTFPTLVAEVDVPSGAAVSVSADGTPYLYTLRPREGGATSVVERRAVEALYPDVRLGEPERVSPSGSPIGVVTQLRGVGGRGGRVGVAWQLSGEGDDVLYERAEGTWKRRANTGLCRRSDNEPTSIWSGRDWVYTARRDASGDVCFDIF